MASFDIAYRKYILPIEGGYNNDPDDKGGETYAGIARNFHPGWPGWTYIDFVKRTKGPIKKHTKFQDIQSQVDQFYSDRWYRNYFSQIKSQEVANLLFDYHTNSESKAILAVQRILKITADGSMGPKTIAAINAADPGKLHDALKAERKIFYDAIVAKHPDQQKWYNGWMNRLDMFPDMISPTNMAIVTVAILVGLGVMIYKSNTVGKLAVAMTAIFGGGLQ